MLPVRSRPLTRSREEQNQTHSVPPPRMASTAPAGGLPAISAASLALDKLSPADVAALLQHKYHISPEVISAAFDSVDGSVLMYFTEEDLQQHIPLRPVRARLLDALRTYKDGGVPRDHFRPAPSAATDSAAAATAAAAPAAPETVDMATSPIKVSHKLKLAATGHSPRGPPLPGADGGVPPRAPRGAPKAPPLAVGADPSAARAARIRFLASGRSFSAELETPEKADSPEVAAAPRGSNRNPLSPLQRRGTFSDIDSARKAMSGDDVETPRIGGWRTRLGRIFGLSQTSSDKYAAAGDSDGTPQSTPRSNPTQFRRLQSEQQAYERMRRAEAMPAPLMSLAPDRGSDTLARWTAEVRQEEASPIEPLKIYVPPDYPFHGPTCSYRGFIVRFVMSEARGDEDVEAAAPGHSETWTPAQRLIDSAVATLERVGAIEADANVPTPILDRLEGSAPILDHLEGSARGRAGSPLVVAEAGRFGEGPTGAGAAGAAAATAAAARPAEPDVAPARAVARGAAEAKGGAMPLAGPGGVTSVR